MLVGISASSCRKASKYGVSRRDVSLDFPVNSHYRPSAAFVDFEKMERRSLRSLRILGGGEKNTGSKYDGDHTTFR